MWIDGVTAFFDPYLDKRIRPGQQVSIPCAGLVSQHFTSKTDAVSVFDLILRAAVGIFADCSSLYDFWEYESRKWVRFKEDALPGSAARDKGQRSQRITLIETCGQRNVSR